MITDSSEQLQWLVDRARISELLIEFARALDDARTRSYMLAVHRSGTGPLPGEAVVTEATA